MKAICVSALLALSSLPAHAQTTDIGLAKCSAFLTFVSNPELLTPHARAYFSGILKGAGMHVSERLVAEKFGTVCSGDPTTSVAAAFSKAIRLSK